MKLEFDELQLISSYLEADTETWRYHVERHGFELPVANAIRARLLKMTQDEEHAYVERFGETSRRPLAKAIMQVRKHHVNRTNPENPVEEELVFNIQLEFNPMDGWYVVRVPAKIAFVLLSKTLESAKRRLEDRGWKWTIIKNDP